MCCAGDRSSADSEDKTLVQDMITTLQAVKVGGQGMERRQCMTQLIRMARSGTTSGLNEHFRTVLRVLLENLEDSEGSTRALVFGVLTEMLKQESLQSGFHGFTELVILKVLQAHKDQEKDVSSQYTVYSLHSMYLVEEVLYCTVNGLHLLIVT